MNGTPFAIPRDSGADRRHGAVDGAADWDFALMKYPRLILIVLAVCALAAPALPAQHAGFVLFGSPDEDGAEQDAAHRHVHPITSPYFHEDSFVTTDIRAVYLYHKFTETSALAGGNLQIYALQLRVALTDQLQFVAYKDGYSDMNPGLKPLRERGWNDVAAGLKWNFLQCWEHQFHAAAGVGYELSIGSKRIHHDDEEIRGWVSVDKGFGRFHCGATFNYFYGPDKRSNDPMDLGNSDRISWHARADYRVCDWLSPVVEANGHYTTKEGKVVVPFQGVDALNLGGGKDDDVVTAAVALELRPLPDLAIRGAYEFPLTNQDDLFSSRFTFSAILSF